MFIPHFADSEQHVSIALSITPLANPLNCALCNPRRRPVTIKAISALRYRTLASFEKGLPGEDGSQYDLSIATLSTHIVTAAVRGDKPADRIGSGNWASQAMGLVGKTLFFYFPRPTWPALARYCSFDGNQPADHQGVGGDDAITAL